MKKIVVIGPESTGKSTLCKQLADHYNTDWVPEYAREYLLKHGTKYTFEDLLIIAKGQIALEDQYLSVPGSSAGTSTKVDSSVRASAKMGSFTGTSAPADSSAEASAKADKNDPDSHTSGGALSLAGGVLYKGGSTPEKLLFIDTNMYVMKVWCEFVFNQCHQWILDRIADRHYDFYFLCDIDLVWEQDGLREYPDLASRQVLYHIYKDIMVNQSVPWTEISGNEEQRLQKAIEAVEKLVK